MTQEHTIRQAYINSLLDGGFTRLRDKTTNPTEGYIVGGLTEATTMPEDKYHPDFNTTYERTSRATNHYAQFTKLWHKYEMQLDEMPFPSGLGVGTWIHEEKIYFDLVQRIYSLNVATMVAKERGEIAIYDCANQKEILL